ncbi:hypothetical protein [Sediminicoccus sp. KRV36]|uniref:hypothetical protein n=1 Tax=Sediminicoccus sp. KRV36 TaxID=3133721 RepID=UPI00200F0E10|nr:hypothetical protein [Sediminicoccus rosea]UPY36909.1 hypothetical protein LHU95_22260 [Sediminicoccus rosea]
MNGFVFALFALGYSGLVLFWLAHALKKMFAPMRAALTAFAMSATVHGVTMLFLEPEHRLTAMAFWAVPHLLLLPALLYSAWRESKGVRG